jgi:hypothetical protein
MGLVVHLTRRWWISATNAVEMSGSILRLRS